MGTDQNANRRLDKVERVIETYDLGGFSEQLADRWAAPEDNDSLRDPTDLMNEKVLDAALHKAGEDVLEGEVENLYALLTGDKTTERMRVRTKSTLQSHGVDVDQLLSDFISHQAVYTYLADIRGVPKDSSFGDRIDSIVESIQRLRDQLVAVIEQSLSSLRNMSKLRLGDFDVLVDTQMYCRGCGTQYEVVELLQCDGCDCDENKSNY